MSTIHVQMPDGQQKQFEEKEIRQLWAGGKLRRDALYWKEGLTEWRPLSEMFVTRKPQAAETIYPTAHRPVMVTVISVMFFALSILLLAGNISAGIMAKDPEKARYIPVTYEQALILGMLSFLLFASSGLGLWMLKKGGLFWGRFALGLLLWNGIQAIRFIINSSVLLRNGYFAPAECAAIIIVLLFIGLFIYFFVYLSSANIRRLFQ